MQRILILTTVLLLTLGVKAQVSDYTFSSSTTTYRQLGNGDVLLNDLSCADEEVLDSIALPFTFTYCGVNYDTIAVSANGYISFANTTSSITANVIDTLPNTIAAFAGDLYACGTDHDIVYATFGVMPNRQFVVQWNNWGLQASGAAELNVQVRLYEGTNKIQIVYGNCTGATTANITVGASGATTADFQTRTTTLDWLLTTAGTATETCDYNTLVKPANGLTFQWSAAATAAGMSFTSFMGTYRPVQGGEATVMTTVAGCYDDQASPAITLPFTFYYHNSPFNTIGVHANGYIKLGGAAPLVYSQILSTETNIIAPFASDLYGCAGGRDITYGVIGTAPNRQYIVQWTNWGFYNSGLNEISLQVILSESDNTIRFAYGPSFPVSSKFISVGLSGASLSDYHTRKTFFNWAATTKGITNTASCSFSPVVYPANGLTFTFTPPVACTGTPGAGITTADNTAVCPGSDIGLHLFGSDVSTEITYQWQVADSVDGSYTDISGAVDSLLTTSNTQSAAYRCALTCSMSGLTGYSTPIYITVLPLPTVDVTGVLSATGCSGDMVTLEVATDTLNTIQWENYGVPVAGATLPQYIATASGLYFAVVSDGTCSAKSDTMAVSIYSLPETVAVTATPDSICAGTPITLNAAAPPTNTVIFTEQWTAADYTASGWTNEDNVDNWTGWNAYTPSGASAPTAYFTWVPSEVNYAHSIISPVIDGTGNPNVYLDYKLLLDNYTSATAEQFTVSYKNIEDAAWTTLETFTNTGGLAITNFVRTNQLLIGCGGHRFQIKCTASGVSSFSINGWGIDDIVVKGSNTYTYSWTADPAGFTGSGQSVNVIENTSGFYTYYATVTNTITGCSTTSASDIVTFTESDVYYADADGDGYGNAAVFLATCGIPSGYVLNDDDCNDASAVAYPGRTEVCDGIDNDCDGFVDNFINATVIPAGPITLCNGSSIVLTCTTGPGYTFKWKKNGAIISGATAASYTVTKAGTYSCMITVSPSCTKTSNSVVVNVNPAPTATITNTDLTNNLCIDPSIKLKANNGTGYTWQWMKSGAAIAGATNITYSATTTGSYRVTVTNTYGCAKTSSLYSIIYACKEGELQETAQMDLFPNPTDGQVKLIMQTGSDYNGPVTINILDMQGRTVSALSAEIGAGYGEQFIQFPDQAAAGMYLIRITGAELNLIKPVELVR